MEPVCATPIDTPIDGSDPRPTEAVASHPAERALRRYAANEMGREAKKRMMKHLAECPACERDVTKYRDLGRRLRELERCAIAAFGLSTKSAVVTTLTR